MAVGYKHRLWEAFVSVSASGPEYSPVLEQEGYSFRRRMAADLRYTTSDVDFLYEHFRPPEVDRPRLEDLHLRLVNPSKVKVLSAIREAGNWLAAHRTHPEWDGGGLHFNYAGHGIEDSGSIVLDDEVLHVDEFIAATETVAAEVSPPGRLRLSVVLDSCHSGAWVTRLLHRCFHDASHLLVPMNLFASCMHDEEAWEDSALGHGLFTYCFSVREPVAGAIAAKAIMPDNSFGPSLSIARGGRGVSFLSAGSQNPVVYWNGAGSLEVSDNDFPIFLEGDDCLTEVRMMARLVERRNAIRARTSSLRDDLRVESFSSDEVTRRGIRETIESIKRHRMGVR